MAFFVQVGFHAQRKQKYTQQGMQVFRRGREEVRRWARIKLDSNGRISWGWGTQEKVDKYPTAQSALAAVNDHCDRFIREGFSRLPSGKRIYAS